MMVLPVWASVIGSEFDSSHVVEVERGHVRVERSGVENANVRFDRRMTTSLHALLVASPMDLQRSTLRVTTFKRDVRMFALRAAESSDLVDLVCLAEQHPKFISHRSLVSPGRWLLDSSLLVGVDGWISTREGGRRGPNIFVNTYVCGRVFGASRFTLVTRE